MFFFSLLLLNTQYYSVPAQKRDSALRIMWIQLVVVAARCQSILECTENFYLEKPPQKTFIKHVPQHMCLNGLLLMYSLISNNIQLTGYKTVEKQQIFM